MPGIHTTYRRLLAGLALIGMTNACQYGLYNNETGPGWGYRQCTFGCFSGLLDEKPDDFLACCLPEGPQFTPAATCTNLASSASITTCSETPWPTTDSVAMSAPSDYTPAFPTEAPVVATSDTAGQAYESPSTPVTVWVTETTTPDCAPAQTSEVTPLASPTESPAYTDPTSSEAAPSNTCACTDAAISAETSDTQGNAYSSYTPEPTGNGYDTGSKPGEGDDLTGLDRRRRSFDLVQRHDVSYTCPCSPGVGDVSDTAGQSYVSSTPTSSAWPAEPTEGEGDDCDDEEGGYDTGSKPEEYIQDNQPPPEPQAKRFIPMDVSFGHPHQFDTGRKRAFEPAPEGFVPDDKPHFYRRTEETEPNYPSSNSEVETVTSTSTVTATCPGTDDSGSTDYPSQGQVTSEYTSPSPSSGYSVSYGPSGGDGSTPTQAPQDNGSYSGGGVLGGAVSGMVDGSTFSLSGEVTLGGYDTGSHPTENVIDNASAVRKR